MLGYMYATLGYSNMQLYSAPPTAHALVCSANVAWRNSSIHMNILLRFFLIEKCSGFLFETPKIAFVVPYLLTHHLARTQVHETSSTVSNDFCHHPVVGHQGGVE